MSLCTIIYVLLDSDVFAIDLENVVLRDALSAEILLLFSQFFCIFLSSPVFAVNSLSIWFV